MEIFSKMELNEVIEYIKSKNKAIVTENMNLYGIVLSRLSEESLFLE